MSVSLSAFFDRFITDLHHLLSLIRTRLQAAGTPAHPQVYEGFWDATHKTFKAEGVVGFYRGLVPTLAKVVPAVSISLCRL